MSLLLCHAREARHSDRASLVPREKVGHVTNIPFLDVEPVHGSRPPPLDRTRSALRPWIVSPDRAATFLSPLGKFGRELYHFCAVIFKVRVLFASFGSQRD